MCISSRKSNQPLHRSAFTLVELLIVMGIIVLLAAITLPSFKTLITSDKVNSASRVVKAHFEAARGRAIASGRPVAVILSRQDPTARERNRLNTVLSLSSGSVFPAYTGDIAGARGTLGPAGSPYNTFTVNTSEASLLASGVFQQNDYIRFDNSGPLYRINDLTPITTGVVHFDNPPAGFAASESILQGAGKQATFQIYRAPTRSFEPPTMFPRGTCIDLSVSGFGTSGADFNSAELPAPSPPPEKQVVGVSVVFSPSGGVESVITSVGRIAPTGLIHFLIGRIDQLNAGNPIFPSDPNDPSTIATNLNEPESVWLTINPFSGAIYTSQNYPGNETTTIATRIQTARTYATNAINRVEN